MGQPAPVRASSCQPTFHDIRGQLGQTCWGRETVPHPAVLGSDRGPCAMWHGPGGASLWAAAWSIKHTHGCLLVDELLSACLKDVTGCDTAACTAFAERFCSNTKGKGEGTEGWPCMGTCGTHWPIINTQFASALRQEVLKESVQPLIRLTQTHLRRSPFLAPSCLRGHCHLAGLPSLLPVPLT